MVFQGVFGDQTQPIFVGENKIMCVCFFGPSNRIKELIILSFSGWNFYIHRSKVLTCSWKWGPRSKRLNFCISGYRISVLLPVFWFFCSLFLFIFLQILVFQLPCHFHVDSLFWWNWNSIIFFRVYEFYETLSLPVEDIKYIISTG